MKKILIFIFILCLLFKIFINDNHFKPSGYNQIIGQWISKDMGREIYLDFTKDYKLKMSIHSQKDSINFEGNVLMDFNKDPISLSIIKIKGVDYSLHSILSMIEENKIVISKFSTNWRLRPINFFETSSITFNRNK